jgi:RNA polymerase-binding transcription factor DksA
MVANPPKPEQTPRSFFGSQISLKKLLCTHPNASNIMPAKSKTSGKKAKVTTSSAKPAAKAKAKSAPAKAQSKVVSKGAKKPLPAKKPAKAAKPAPKAPAKSPSKVKNAKPAPKAKPASKPVSKVKAKAAAPKPKAKPVAAKPAPKPTVKKQTAKAPAPKIVKTPAKPAAKTAKAVKPQTKPAAPVKAAAPAVVAPAKPPAPAKTKKVAEAAVKVAPPAPKRPKKDSPPPPTPLGKMPRRRVMDEPEITIEPIKGPVKMTPFLIKQKKRLTDLRDAYLNSIEGVASETIRQRPEDGANSAFGMHQADAGSDAYDRDFALSLLGKEQDALYEINEALKRIEQGVYGICEMSAEKIPHERLEALPFTRYTVGCQERIERQQMGGRWNRPVRSLFGLDDASETSADASEDEESDSLDSSRE